MSHKLTFTLADEQSAVASLQQCLDDHGPFLRLADAARTAGVPAATVYQAVREGRIPAVHVPPRGWLVRVSAIRLALTSETGLHKKRGRPKRTQ